MGAVAFNTYDFVKSLADAGMDEKHAAAISAGILRAHEVADLATKADLRESQAQTKADLREEMTALRIEMRESQADLREEMAELRTDLQAVKTEIRESQVQNKAEMRELELRMTIKLGSMMIIGIGVLTAVIKFL